MAEDTPAPLRRHRAAVYISERDRAALAAGTCPSWEEPADVRERPEEASASGPNDRRLLDDVPPHY
ncbi:toxin [Nanchangia anserum]|uniref:Toxin n=1 Tax=Nanchangia anserum TaxID=2692125 RepID=A0A8I0KR64_9ACTO|nr:toxin [Nanchangia anserum]MBD3689122.1 toxin [Nanchangia anserum]QOX81356.1 toxin [Nanchangia anserum]